MAMIRKNFEACKLFLERGADINARYSLGHTLLDNAVEGRYMDEIKFLLENGADVSSNNLSRSPLKILARKFEEGDIEIYNLLLEHGADIGAKSGENTLLHKTVLGKNIEMLKFIFKLLENEKYKGKIDIFDRKRSKY